MVHLVPKVKFLYIEGILSHISRGQIERHLDTCSHFPNLPPMNDHCLPSGPQSLWMKERLHVSFVLGKDC